MADLLTSLVRPLEVAAICKLKFGGHIRKVHKQPLTQLAQTLSDVDFCYAVLNKVSRSFAVVIQQLPEQLRDPVCIFYLVLRGLDSVEDDMTLDNRVKVPMLLSFHDVLNEDGWCAQNIGDGPDYRVLLAHFHKVIRVYKSLAPQYQAVIKDITLKMGKGMAEFAVKPLGEGVETIDAYNLYCHYVAGLVGHGLSGLFAGSGLEDPNLDKELHISNSMGLFLQKTNIIRDYLEDLQQQRTWWPKEIWGKYGQSLDQFGKYPTAHKSMACLNHMVTDALSHVPDVLDYLGRIRDPKVFEFCAIPQVMAISTLALVYNNSNVYTKVVKVRKGLSCRMMLESCNLKQVNRWFHTALSDIEARVPLDDPNRTLTLKIAREMKARVRPNKTLSSAPFTIASIFAWVIFIVCACYLYSYFGQRRQVAMVNGPSPLRLNVGEISAFAGLLLSMAYLFGFFGVPFVQSAHPQSARDLTE